MKNTVSFGHLFFQQGWLTKVPLCTPFHTKTLKAHSLWLTPFNPPLPIWSLLLHCPLVPPNCRKKFQMAEQHVGRKTGRLRPSLFPWMSYPHKKFIPKWISEKLFPVEKCRRIQFQEGFCARHKEWTVTKTCNTLWNQRVPSFTYKNLNLTHVGLKP